MTEIWKDVVGYEDYFQVSNTGKIFSKRSNKELKQNIHETGYCTVATKFGGRNGTNKCFRVHVEIAKAFIPNPENKPTVNHIDGIKTNNNVGNLEWATYAEQMRHAVDTGLAPILSGTEVHNAKLSEDDVRFIRQHYKRGDKEFGTHGLGRRFGVHHTKISKVVRNVSYKNVT